jgi:hypothetical protein
MPEESSQMQYAYNLEYASCIGSLIYMSYTRPDISLLHYNKHLMWLMLTYYSDMTKSPVYQIIQEKISRPQDTCSHSMIQVGMTTLTIQEILEDSSHVGVTPYPQVYSSSLD